MHLVVLGPLLQQLGYADMFILKPYFSVKLLYGFLYVSLA